MEAVSKFIEYLAMEWTGGLEHAGYWGVFVLMMIESSFIPLPSEIVMLPAGVLAAEGKMNLWGALLAGTAGSLAGALVNYYLAIYAGRAFLLRYGRYVLVPADKLQWVERYWDSHGEMTTFVCRLLPVLRHLISLPAGLARMNLARFCFFTTLGAAIWVLILTLTGYFFGQAAIHLWDFHKTAITAGLFLGGGCLTLAYVIRHRLRQPTRTILAGECDD